MISWHNLSALDSAKFVELKPFCEKQRPDHPSLNSKGEQILVLSSGLTEWNYFHMSPLHRALTNCAGLGQMLVCMHWHYTGMQRETLRNEYRAGTSIHRVLIKGLANSEGDEGGADAGGRLDGQALPLLGDFHRGAGGCCHCNLP